MSFNASHLGDIYGGAHNVVHGNQINLNQVGTSDDTPQILRQLAAQAAMNACHYAEERFPPPNCHPNTRIKTLNTLGKWIQDTGSTNRVYWVHGSAGVGKSAIAQKISEDYPNHLVGAFFYSRNDSTRDKLGPFVATIAYQCCASTPLKDIVGPFILNAIRSNPNIFDATSETQFRELLLEPFSLIDTTQHPALPKLIVVDGLDECLDLSSQERLLGIIDIAITRFASPNPFPFIFLLCSRPEPQIRNGIADAGFTPYLNDIEISGTTIRFLGYLSESDLDIQRYFKDKFASLRNKYRNVLQLQDGEPWPRKGVIEDLTWRASGQFIFAVTVIKYIDSMDEHPQDRLETILSLEPEPDESPYSALDTLYRQILSTCRHWNRVYLILQLLVTLHPELEGVKTNVLWHSSEMLAGLLHFKPGIVEASLSRLHSVIHVPESHSDGAEIRIRHASFTEFLLNSSRSGEFYVKRLSVAKYCDLVTVFLLCELSSFASSYPPYRSTTKDVFVNWKHKTLSVSRHMLSQFSLQYWPYYCCRVESPSVDLIAKLNEFDPYVTGSFLPNLEHIPARSFHEWRTVLEWAKGLSDAPFLFIKKIEAFFRGFYIGYSKDALRLDAVRWTFEVEWGLISLRNWLDAEDMGDFTGAIYDRGWAEDLRGISIVSHPILLPEDTFNPSRIFPNDWVVVRVAQSNGELMKRVYDARKAFYAAQEVEDDIMYDTSESVSQCVLEERDLAAFKALIYERRDLLTGLATARGRKSRKSPVPPPGRERQS